MISIPWSIFNMEEDQGQEMSKNRFNDTQNKKRCASSSSSSSSSTSVDVGLRILLIQLSQGKSNVVFKPTFLLKIKPTFRSNRIDPHASYYSESTFLKSCYLCNKSLSLDKDIYMYRGDQGFCSVECRNRQIYLDEMKEIEESTKKMLATFRQCGPSSDHRCETRALLEQFRQRHKPLVSCTDQKDRAIML